MMLVSAILHESDNQGNTNKVKTMEINKLKVIQGINILTQ